MSVLSRIAPQLRFSAPTSKVHDALATSNHISGVQLYSNILGTAVNVRFDDFLSSTSSSSSSASSFEGGKNESFPLSNPLALGICESAVLEHFFLKQVSSSSKQQQAGTETAEEKLEKRLGVLNTCYHTFYPALLQKNNKRNVFLPFAGSAEFTRLPHRSELNVCVTLWERNELKNKLVPLSTTTWTGPRSLTSSAAGNAGLGIELTNADVQNELKKLQRKSNYSIESSGGEGKEREEKQEEKLIDISEGVSFSSSSSSSSSSSTRLFETVVPQKILSSSLKKTSNDGFSALVVPNASSSSSSSDPVPLFSAAHDSILCTFASLLWSRENLHPTTTNPRCQLVAKTATLGAVNANESFELRTSPILFSNSLWSKPWERKSSSVGLPTLRGEPCMALRVETIQKDNLAGIGTYYFAPAATS